MEQENENLNDLVSGQEFLTEQKIVIGGGTEDDPESLNEFDNTLTEKARGKKKREVALVFDRYYEKTPRTFLLLAGKVLFCCALCVCSMMFVLTNFDMPIDLTAAAFICFGCTAAFSTLFLFVRKSIAIPVAILACSVVVWHNRDPFWEKLSYFIDAMILQLDGRLLQTRETITHTELLATDGENFIKPKYAPEIMFGIALVCVLFSLIVSASMFKRPHFLPIVVPFLAMWAPRMIAERMVFNPWVIPAAALYAGALAMTISHKDGLAIRQGFTHSYRGIVARNEHLFDLRTENAAYFRKIGLRGAYNSKYFSLAVCSIALFLAAALTANAITASSRGIDYTKLYDYVKNLGSIGSGVTSPFKDGPVSEYFTNPEKTEFEQGAGLSITNPGKGEQEIMRVKNSGTLPIYMRGDIGMEFNGKGWTSPAAKEPQKWTESGLGEVFRPLELEALMSFGELAPYIEKAELSVDYLCDTSVVFAPAYIDYYDSYLDSELFTVRADFVIRTTDKAGKLGSMRGNVRTPRYIGVDEADRATALEGVSAVMEKASFSEVFSWVCDELAGENFTELYRRYVYGSYMDVPEQYREPISQYIDDNLLDMISVSNVYEYGNFNLNARYSAACAVADYLRDNYDYSLNARVNARNPVMSFLNETKSGHCALYASAMTLIMREMGIPARYCTGFVARPTDGGSTVLRSKNLHAWCEVYLDELGWVTFDPTSSVSVEEAINGITSDPDSSSSTSESDPSSEPSSSSESSDSSSETSSESSSPTSRDSSPGDGTFDPGSDMAVVEEKIDVMPYVLTILAILAGIALIAFIIYRIRKFDKNAKKAMKRFYTAENPQSVYARLLAVLRLCKLTPNGGELSGEFFKRAGRELGCNIAKRRELLEMLAFGSGELSDTEKAQLGRLLEKIFAAADKKLGLIGKVKLRIIMLTKRY